MRWNERESFSAAVHTTYSTDTILPRLLVACQDELPSFDIVHHYTSTPGRATVSEP